MEKDGFFTPILDRHRGPTMRTIILAGLLFGIAFTSAPGAEAAGRPNVILIIADDMAWDDCGAYGHPGVRTPHIDALARGGMRFDRAFVTASSCSPSRSSILTGRYPHNTGAEELHQPLPPEQITFVEKLKTSGYWTAQAGKWHLGDAVKGRFDQVREAGASGFQLATGPASRAPMVAQGVGAVQSGCDQWVPVLRDRPRDRPFFLWLAALDPHRDYQEGTIPRPHRSEDAVVPPYLPDVPEVRKDLALYYDEIARLDHYVGEVMAELDRQGEAGNTMILFLSDNGRPFPRCKTTLYDSGIRTPWIVRWPGHVEPGSRCASLVSTVDIAPTVLGLAGIEPGPSFQGKDFSPLFKDPRAKVREFVFAERNWHDFAARGRAVRSERFKYIRNDDHTLPLTPPADAVRSPTFRAMRRLRDEGRLTPAQRACFVHPRLGEELYDVDADPHELHNLAGDPKFAEVIGPMRQALEHWERETTDRATGTLSPDEFDRETGEPLPNRVRPRPAKKPSQSTSDSGR
jgi:N-sulfoglucosamine sulfohydrolase